MAVDVYAIHEIAKIFPRISGDMRELMKDDIRKYGVRQPVIVWDAGGGNYQIIDGRNRYEIICELTSPEGENLQYATETREPLECPAVEFEGDEAAAVREAMRLNSVRRHLNSSQLACLAVLAESVLEASGNDAAALADAWGTNRNYLFDARKLLRGGARDLLDAVIEGSTSIKDAVARMDKRMAGIPDGPAGEEAATPTEKPPLLDALKRDIPKGLEVVFEAVPVFKEAAKALEKCRRVMEDLANGPAGAGIPRQEMMAKFKQLRRDILGSVPYIPCPYCNGRGKVKTRMCGQCGGTAVLDKLQYDRLPREMVVSLVAESGGCVPDSDDD